MPATLAFKKHNHQHCIEQAIQRAQDLCRDTGVKLTQQRKQVLQLIWKNHKPLGAYPLMAMLEEETGRRVAPPTVYRALDFLLEQGLIHRVHSLNAYIGCVDPGHGHTGNLLICTECGATVELESTTVDRAIQREVETHQFAITQHILEIAGLCPRCRK